MVSKTCRLFTPGRINQRLSSFPQALRVSRVLSSLVGPHHAPSPGGIAGRAIQAVRHSSLLPSPSPCCQTNASSSSSSSTRFAYPHTPSVVRGTVQACLWRPERGFCSCAALEHALPSLQVRQSSSLATIDMYLLIDAKSLLRCLIF